MKIINKQEFFALGQGVLYSNYSPSHIDGLKIKGDTIHRDGKPIDYTYQDLIGNIDADSSEDLYNKISDSVKNGSSFDLDFDCGERDGMYSDEEMFAIYEAKDIKDLIRLLITIAKDYANTD